MFTVRKFARCDKIDARKRYSAGQIEAATDLGNTYGWPYTTPICGCGDTVPADYKAESVYRFDSKYSEAYTLADFKNDLEAVVESFDGDLKAVVLGAVNGWSLWKNSNIKPQAKSTRKMTDDEKVGWVAIHLPTQVASLAGKPVAEWLKVYHSVEHDND
jgi:hypothetical protein